jgi:hypothetical protein
VHKAKNGNVGGYERGKQRKQKGASRIGRFGGVMWLVGLSFIAQVGPLVGAGPSGEEAVAPGSQRGGQVRPSATPAGDSAVTVG